MYTHNIKRVGSYEFQLIEDGSHGLNKFTVYKSVKAKYPLLGMSRPVPVYETRDYDKAMAFMHEL